MLIDKYIVELQKLRALHGPDMEVLKAEGAKAPLPRIAHMHTQHPRTFFKEGADPDKFKGRKVVKV